MIVSRLLIAALAVAVATPAIAQDISGDVLSAHNRLRAQHGAPALSWSGNLAAGAQEWANQCAFDHSSGNYGENLAMGTTGAYTIRDHVQGWYDEIGSYDFGNPGYSDATGHFTQVVWVGTTQLGCGLAQCGDGNDLLVCRYSPAGNMDGAFPENVLSK